MSHFNDVDFVFDTTDTDSYSDEYATDNNDTTDEDNNVEDDKTNETTTLINNNTITTPRKITREDNLEDNTEDDVKTTIKNKKVVKKPKQTKKGPGRPRKNPKKEPIPKKGITRMAVSGDETMLEFLYDCPFNIKRVILFFKSLAASQIQIIFRPTDVIMYAKDHHKKSDIYVKIDATKINQYFCKNVFDIGVSLREMDLSLSKVDKDYGSIVIFSTTSDSQKNITLMYEDMMQQDFKDNIDLVGQYQHMENEHEFLDEDYTIQFEWPGKYFKKVIDGIKQISGQIAFVQSEHDNPMEIQYVSRNRKLRCNQTIKHNDKIKFKSNIKDDSSFRVEVKVDYLRPIAASHFADKITIYLDENKKLMTKAQIDDGAIEIKTLTNIIDERPNDVDLLN
jgi:hypothetical protein